MKCYLCNTTYTFLFNHDTSYSKRDANGRHTWNIKVNLSLLQNKHQVMKTCCHVKVWLR